ncbi:glycosyltransferase, partial [Escherichia coli]|nr:glycosyltransferase [Escherichia coli]
MKVSIITVTYNSEKTLRNTLESIELQTYNDIEYIIIDGGSTDNTLK